MITSDLECNMEKHRLKKIIQKQQHFNDPTVRLASCDHHLSLPKLSCLEESSHGHLSELNLRKMYQEARIYLHSPLQE